MPSNMSAPPDTRHSEEQTSTVDLFELARHVWQAEAASVAALPLTVDPAAFCHCVEALAACRGQILTTGFGTSAARRSRTRCAALNVPPFFVARRRGASRPRVGATTGRGDRDLQGGIPAKSQT